MVLPVFFLSSCSREILPSSKSPVLNFSAMGSFLENESIVNFNLTFKEQNEILIEIVSPPGAQGLTFKKENGKVVVKYKDLEVKNESSNLISGSFISDILDILEYFEKNSTLNVIATENGVSTYSGSTDSGNFEIDMYDSSGFIKEIRFLKHNLVVKLSDHKQL